MQDRGIIKGKAWGHFLSHGEGDFEATVAEAKKRNAVGKLFCPIQTVIVPETLHDLAEILVVAVTSEIGDLLGIVEEEEFCLFSDPEDDILEVEAEAELKESADASAPTGLHRAAMRLSLRMRHKSDADLLKRLIDTDILRKAAGYGRFARAGLLSKPPPPRDAVTCRICLSSLPLC